MAYGDSFIKIDKFVANWHGSFTHWGIFDASTAGNLLWWGALDAGVAAVNGSVLKFLTGELDLTLT